MRRYLGWLLAFPAKSELAMIVLALALALVLLAARVHAADAITECSASRANDGAYWSWREVERRRCWYRGAPGRSKSLLRWAVSSPRSSAGGKDRPEVVENPRTVPGDLGADPIAPTPVPTTTIVRTEEEPWQATTEDQLLAFTCCWPEPTIPAKSQERYNTPTIDLPPATPPRQMNLLWLPSFLLVIVVALTIMIARRSLT